MARRRARELAFRALFQSEQGGFSLTEVWEELSIENSEASEGEMAQEVICFAKSLLDSVSVNREAIDRRIEGLVEGWSFPQMAQTDLNILRLAVAEMEHGFDTPAEVAIEMAVRISKKYGGADSGRFVNGVLAQLYRDLTLAI